MHAYTKMYLDDAMNNLGEAFDYAYRCCDVTPSDFMRYFINCGLADRFGHGSPKYTVGMSGTELAREILRRTYGYENNHEFPPAQIEYDYSPEYWTGWIITYYQWSRGVSFRIIVQKLPVDVICNSYKPLHEASEERAAVWFDESIANTPEKNELQRMRRLLGYTQRLLAEKTGVNLRTLQQYEIGSKDLSKASAATVYALSKELGCSMEDLVS